MDCDLAKIFVGGISWETKEDTLKDHFNEFGEVVDTVIMRDRNTGSARGFGFVQFSDPSVADKVIHDKHVILGRTVEVKKAVPRGDQQHHTHQQQHHHHHHAHQHHQQNRGFTKNGGGHNNNNNHQFKTKKIFVGGLSANLTEDEFRGYFEKFGRITDVVVMYDSATHRPRGFGFITFDSEEAVENVVKQKSFHELNGKLVEVKRAVPKDGNNNGNNGGGYNVRMGGGGGGGGGRGSIFGSYQGGGGYPPFSPRYGVYPGYGAPPLPGFANGGGYYVGGYSMGGYAGVGYGGTPILAPRSPWNGPGIRRSPAPYGTAGIFPGYMNGSLMAMPGGGYRGIMGPVANGKWNQGAGAGAGELQMQAGTTSPTADGGKLDDDSAGLMGSYGAGAGKQNQRGPDGRFRPYLVGNSS